VQSRRPSPPAAPPDAETLQRRAAADPGVIGFGGGLPADVLFPRAALTAAFVRAVQRPAAAALQYGWPEGLEGLRTQIAERLRRRGAAVAPEEVLVTNGAQQALAIALQILCRAGARVGVDPETYPGALDVFTARGLVAAPLDGDVRALYLMPALSNPRGHGMDDLARARARARRLPIIEDDAYADLRFEGPAGRPLLADDRERVFHVGTFSKTLCPGLRVGYLVPPPRHKARALRWKRSADLQPNTLAQTIVEDFLGHQDFDARIVKLRRYYGRKAARLLEALRRELPRWEIDEPEGGFAVWCYPDEERPELDFLARAVDEGVSFDPGSMFRGNGAVTPLAVRLCHSSVDEARIEEGVRRLARAWRRLAGPGARGPRARPASPGPGRTNAPLRR
jgi:2-aminoadipate transaminase